MVYEVVFAPYLNQTVAVSENNRCVLEPHVGTNEANRCGSSSTFGVNKHWGWLIRCWTLFAPLEHRFRDRATTRSCGYLLFEYSVEIWSEMVFIIIIDRYIYYSLPSYRAFPHFSAKTSPFREISGAFWSSHMALTNRRGPQIQDWAGQGEQASHISILNALAPLTMAFFLKRDLSLS